MEHSDSDYKSLKNYKLNSHDGIEVLFVFQTENFLHIHIFFAPLLSLNACNSPCLVVFKASFVKNAFLLSSCIQLSVIKLFSSSYSNH